MSNSNTELVVLSLRYSSWSMRPWLALTHAGVRFETRTVVLDDMKVQESQDGIVKANMPSDGLGARRSLGSVTGLFPVLWIDGVPIHESLAICEWAAERNPEARLWPADAVSRAQARSLSLEMVAGFPSLRQHMSCNVFARVPGFEPSADIQREIDRVTESWAAALQRSGGPFLFGDFGIADCMYFPVLTRFETYGVTVPEELRPYAAAIHQEPTVKSWKEQARVAPRIPAYDAFILSIGGDPDAVLPSG